MRIIIITIIMHFLCIITAAQDIKFGKINTSDLAKKEYSIDPEASAVILSDIGSSELVGNKKGWFSIAFTRHVRIHILHKNSFSKATIAIPLYMDNNMQEELKSVKASSYNLENGKIVESKLEKVNLFKEKKDKNHVIQKFTIPNVKEGTIIEYQFQIISDFLFNLQPWIFQSELPTLWSEYKVSLPPFIKYMSIGQTFQKYHLEETRSKPVTYAVNQKKQHYSQIIEDQRLILTTSATEYRWAMKDLQALKIEPYISSAKNFINRLEFQLAGFDEPLEKKNVKTTWQEATEDLLNHEFFGKPLQENQALFQQIINPLIDGISHPNKKARIIYEYVRNNFRCNNEQSLFIDESLKNVIKTKSGSIGEINLLLTGLLKSAGFEADPVILSTRGNGIIRTTYPMLRKYNYVISQIKIDNEPILLDASQKNLGFGKLLAECYNGDARIINSKNQSFPLKTEMLLEKEVTIAKVVNVEGSWQAKIERTSGVENSLHIRNKVNDIGKENYYKKIQAEYGDDIILTSLNIDSLDNTDYPISENFILNFKNYKEDILYVNPVFISKWNENPFKSADRNYPIEMPYLINDSYHLTMEIPKGYKIDEIPKQILLKLNSKGDAVFEYKILVAEDVIHLYTSLKFNQTHFDSSLYEDFREFFKLVVSKHNEQIVFKKL